MEATVAERGQITLPKAVRDALGLTKGSVLKVELEGSRIILRKSVDDAISRARGRFRLDGFESTKLIRADEQNRQLPRMSIVALTANALSEDEARCLQAGMDGYLSKPFTESQLLAMLSKHLPQATNASGAQRTLSPA